MSDIVRVGVIPAALEGAALRAFSFLLLELNHLQSRIEFELLPVVSHVFLDPHTKNTSLDHHETIEDVNQFLEEYIEYIQIQSNSFKLSDQIPDGFILISNVKFTDNFYSARTGNFQIIALGNWSRYMAPPSIVEFFLILSLRYSIGFVKQELFNSSHINTKGCLWDVTPNISEARFKVLNGFICNSCMDKFKKLHIEDFAEELKNILRKKWLGDPSSPYAPSEISAKLGYDLFISKGLKPTYIESLKNLITLEYPKEILKIIGGIILALLLIWLGLKGK